jgi:hypothetical protein
LRETYVPSFTILPDSRRASIGWSSVFADTCRLVSQQNPRREVLEALLQRLADLSMWRMRMATALTQPSWLQESFTSQRKGSVDAEDIKS